jgi:hypothetical protein
MRRERFAGVVVRLRAHLVVQTEVIRTDRQHG